MPKSKVDGWICSECRYEWRPKEKGFKDKIVSCPKCQNKEVNTY